MVYTEEYIWDFIKMCIISIGLYGLLCVRSEPITKFRWLTHINHAACILISLTHKFESCGEDGVVVAARVVECGDDEGGGHEGVDGGGELRLAVGEQLRGEAAQHRRHALDGETQQHRHLFVLLKCESATLSSQLQFLKATAISSWSFGTFRSSEQLSKARE